MLIAYQLNQHTISLLSWVVDLFQHQSLIDEVKMDVRSMDYMAVCSFQINLLCEAYELLLPVHYRQNTSQTVQHW